MQGLLSNKCSVALHLRPGDFICTPIAICKPNSEGQTSLCGTSNPCQGSFQLGFFQLCVEQLEDAEVGGWVYV